MTTGPVRDLLPVASPGDTAHHMWRLVRRRPTPLVVAAIAFFLIGLAGTVPVLMIGRVVDTVREDGPPSDLVWLTAVIAISGLVGAVAAAVSTAALASAVAPALATVRESVLEGALGQPSARIEAAGIGDVVSRVGDDVRHVTESLDEAVPAMLASIVTLVFTIGGLFTLDWRIGLSGLAAAPCYLWALRWYLPKSAPKYRNQRIAEGERADSLVAGISGAATLRELGRSSDGVDRIEDRSQDAVRVTVDVYRLFTRFGFRMNLSEMVGLMAVLTGGYIVVRTGTGTIGDATAAALFFHRLFNPIGALLFLFDVVQSAGAALTRLVGVARLDVPHTPSGDLGPEPALHLHGVGHSYEPGHPVLEPTDLQIAPGEHIAVVGATGAGKSTLGAIAAGSIHPTCGSVMVGDVVLSDLSESAAREHVVLVSQDVHVFAGTVRDNLLLARADADDEALLEALELTGAIGWVTALQSGLDTVLGHHGHSLTAARAQQLALARVVLRDPAVVVLDEASAEAGSAGARDLETATRSVLAGRTAIVIAHRLTQAQQADRIVVMDAGRIVEEGPHAQLVASGGRYADLWTAWSGR
ncbi:ABC transporter ATP-binding protein [Aeromicrobium sp. CF3.5]|uniref:ABC transporter ATP-binding protein n=1 Tax=Aeromicrobium sp. CF3.5 TaxID=3373078 RepID=UPI003EE71FB7